MLDVDFADFKIGNYIKISIKVVRNFKLELEVVTVAGEGNEKKQKTLVSHSQSKY